MKRKVYVKPAGVAIIALMASGLTACAMSVAYTADKSSETEIVQEPANLSEFEGVQEVEEIKKLETRTYYRVNDGGASAMLDEKYQSYIYDLCEKYGIAGYEQLVLAMFYAESSYRFDVVSKSNDYGIAQINICNHDWLREELGVTDFLDPEQSMECGVYLIAGHLANNGGDIQKALVAYNMGQSKVNAGIEESAYSRRVIEVIGNMTEESVEFIL